MKEKIIQITAIPFNCEAGYILFGLDDNGKVWSYNQEKDVWERHVRPLSGQEQ